jgi:ParB family chromosome partitioning protein
MSLLTFSINLDTIASPTLDKICNFDTTQVDNLAYLFLRAGDTVRPIILRKISPVKFEILEGYFEYYAAMKAQEIDDQFTAIQAHVVPTDLESTILEQYNFLRSLSTSAPLEISAPETRLETQPDLAQIENAIANRLEQKLSVTVDRIVEERINASLQIFANQITQQINLHLLDFKQSLAFVPISQVLSPTQPIISVPESAPEKIPKSKTTKTATTKAKATSSKPKAKDKFISDDPKVLQVINDLNTMNFGDLQRNLAKSAKGNTKFAKPIYELKLQQPEQKFQSIQDVIANVQGLAEKTMQKIIDAW